MSNPLALSAAQARLVLDSRLETEVMKIATLYPLLSELQNIFLRQTQIIYAFLISSTAAKTYPSLALFDRNPRDVDVETLFTDWRFVYDIDFALVTSDDIADELTQISLAKEIYAELSKKHKQCAAWPGDVEFKTIYSEGQTTPHLSLLLEDHIRFQGLQQMRMPGGIFLRRNNTEGVLFYKKSREKTDFDMLFEKVRAKFGLPRNLESFLDETIRPYLKRGFDAFPNARIRAVEYYPEHAEFFNNL